MTYAEWESGVPVEIKADPLWCMKVYRQALFLCDLSWEDVTKLSRDLRTKSLSNQLYRSTGSVAANIEEGYSKNSSKDRARFYEYALGSGRESRGWYYRGRHVLGEKVFVHRCGLLTEIIKMLMTIVPAERSFSVQEDLAEYYVESSSVNEIPF